MKNKVDFKLNSSVNRLEMIISIIIICYQVLYTIIPIRQVFHFLHISTIAPILVIIGFGFSVLDLLTNRYFLKAKYSYFLIATLVVLTVSAFVNINYSIVANAKIIIWQAVQMLFLYTAAWRMPKEKLKKTSFICYAIISITYVISAIVSIVQFLTLNSYHTVSLKDGVSIRQGFSDGRLFGVFSTPYFATMVAALIMLISPYLFKRTKNVLLKVWYCFSSYVLLMYILLTKTRSIIVALAVAFIVFMVLMVRNEIYKNRSNNQPLKQLHKRLFMLVSTIAVAFLISIGGFAVINNAHTIFPSDKVIITDDTTANQNNSNINDNDSVDGDNTNNNDENPFDNQDNNNNNASDNSSDNNLIFDPDSTIIDEDSFHRNDTGKDISNNRFKIWKNYVDAISKSPKSAIFGFSAGNYMEAIRDQNPDIYIVKYFEEKQTILFERGRIYDTHNGYLSIYVMTGILGVLVFGSFLILCIIKCAKHLFSKRKISDTVMLTTVMVVTILVSIFFDSDLFFRCTSTSVIFWFVAGILMHKIEEDEKIIEN